MPLTVQYGFWSDVGCLPMNNRRMRLFLFSFWPYMFFSYIIPVYMKRSDSSSTFDTEKSIKMQNWFTNDWHKYFPEGIYRGLGPWLHITMQMSRPSYFGIYWNTVAFLFYHWSEFFSELYIYLFFGFIRARLLCNTPKGHLNIDCDEDIFKHAHKH